MLTVAQYNNIFEKERRSSYPIIDRYESSFGFAIDRDRLESMARVLACPLKVNPPNWQHGRVIYTTLRNYLRAANLTGYHPILDIGTAKGFSACVMSHAIADSQSGCGIVSVDVVSPNDKIRRNSVAELDGLKTIDEFVVGHYNPIVPMSFYGRGSVNWLNFALEQNLRVPFAFVDGKHTYDAVTYEAVSLMQLQRSGDIVIFDDCQMEPVGRAVRKMSGYDVIYLDIGVRTYAIAVRV